MADTAVVQSDAEQQQVSAPVLDDRIAHENWQRYQYGVTRGHRDYTMTAAMLEGFYLGGQYDAQGHLMPGGHWNDADLAALEEQRRPAYEFNQTKPAIDAAVGYQINNRMDISFKPRRNATQELADVRSQVAMQIADNNKLHWRETEVFADGMIEQRGYFDCRMDFEDNIFGELRIDVLDPRDGIPDPDAKSYDPYDWGDFIKTRWLTLDEIEGLHGKEARNRVEASGRSYLDERDFGEGDLDGAPRNKFGNVDTGRYDAMYTGGDGVQRYRIIDRQKWVRMLGDVAVYPTGDMRVLTGDELPEALAEMQAQGIRIIKRRVRRVRWSVSTATVTLHDDWSPYDRLTVVPFFPYFRRGKTRGMVDNAVGPQKALDKGISQAIHIINTTANSGWQLEQGQLTNMTTEQLMEQGASTGLVLERKEGTAPLTKIQSNPMPDGIEKIIDIASFTLKEVTVPDAMRGNQGNEDSGIAIQSRQHAAQQILAVPLDNLARTRHMLADWINYAIGKYYDSERTLRITKTDPVTGAENDEELVINKFEPATGKYFNDMTQGEYDIVVTEQPMQVTFENSQFQQLMEMRKNGVGVPDPVVIKHSNLSDKHEIIRELQGAQQPVDPTLEAKAKLIEAQTRKTLAEAVNKSVEGMFSATQAANQIAMVPSVAPLADQMLRSAGFQDADAAPAIPSVPEGTAPVPMRENTNPLTPMNPGVGIDQGIEGGGE